MKLRVAITGAGGFLGGALARRLLADGAEVHALSRRPVSLPGAHWQAYDLAGGTPDLPQVDAVVHAAFDMGGAGPEREQRNFSATRNLLAAARDQGKFFVFISSMSAHDGALSSYGRAKRAIERTLDPAVDAIVRPGVIVGPGGVYARMLLSLQRAPLVPVFYGGSQPVQPVGLEELVEALVRIVTRRATGEFNLGTPDPMSIRELYSRMLAANGLSRILVPLPGGLVLPVLRGAESIGLRLPLTAENLLGQKCLRAFTTADSFSRLGLHPKPAAELPWNPSPRA